MHYMKARRLTMTQAQAQKKATEALRANPNTLGMVIRANAKSGYSFQVIGGQMVFQGKVAL
jgi:exopolyphosphatase/pppGpp-phosphohydrolase